MQSEAGCPARFNKVDPGEVTSDTMEECVFSRRAIPHAIAARQPVVPNYPDYVLIRKLGAGAFGEVWHAHGPGGLDVALKFIRLDPHGLAPELRSLEVMKSIRHPNLVSLFGAWHKDHWLILAMELCDRTLQDRLAEALHQKLPGIPLEELLDVNGSDPGPLRPWIRSVATPRRPANDWSCPPKTCRTRGRCRQAPGAPCRRKHPRGRRRRREFMDNRGSNGRLLLCDARRVEGQARRGPYTARTPKVGCPRPGETSPVDQYQGFPRRRTRATISERDVRVMW